MAFTMIRRKMDAGDYLTWDAFQADMETMFNNAMIYNTPDTIYHKQVLFAYSSFCFALLGLVSRTPLSLHSLQHAASNAGCKPLVVTG